MIILTKNRILIVIIIFILALSVMSMYLKHVNQKEKFLDKSKCTFVPRGDDEFKCINECRKYSDICDSDTCLEKCRDCNNLAMCKWLKKKDNTQREQPTVSSDEGECQFKPYGKSLEQCIKHCSQREDRTRYGGSNCTNFACANICYQCKDKEWCEWTTGQGLEPPNSTILFGSSGYNQFTLLWDDIPNVKYFTIICYEKENPDESLRVEKILKENIFEKYSGKIKYIIKDVKRNTPYNFYILCANDNGLSLPSNEITLKLKEESKIFIDENKNNEDDQTNNEILFPILCKDFKQKDFSEETKDLFKDKKFTINLR